MNKDYTCTQCDVISCCQNVATSPIKYITIGLPLSKIIITDSTSPSRDCEDRCLFCNAIGLVGKNHAVFCFKDPVMGLVESCRLPCISTGFHNLLKKAAGSAEILIRFSRTHFVSTVFPGHVDTRCTYRQTNKFVRNVQIHVQLTPCKARLSICLQYRFIIIMFTKGYACYPVS
jgi:hypothetical protein